MRVVDPPALDLEPPLDLVDDLAGLYVERERVVLVSRVVVIVPSLFRTDRVFVVVVLEEVLVGRLVL